MDAGDRRNMLGNPAGLNSAYSIWSGGNTRRCRSETRDAPTMKAVAIVPAKHPRANTTAMTMAIAPQPGRFATQPYVLNRTPILKPEESLHWCSAAVGLSEGRTRWRTYGWAQETRPMHVLLVGIETSLPARYGRPMEDFSLSEHISIVTAGDAARKLALALGDRNPLALRKIRQAAENDQKARIMAQRAERSPAMTANCKKPAAPPDDEASKTWAPRL